MCAKLIVRVIKVLEDLIAFCRLEKLLVMALSLGLISAGLVGTAVWAQTLAVDAERKQRIKDNMDTMASRPGRPFFSSEINAKPVFTRGQLKPVGTYPYNGGDMLTEYSDPATGQPIFQVSTNIGPGFGMGEATM